MTQTAAAKAAGVSVSSLQTFERIQRDCHRTVCYLVRAGIISMNLADRLRKRSIAEQRCLALEILLDHEGWCGEPETKERYEFVWSAIQKHNWVMVDDDTGKEVLSLEEFRRSVDQLNSPDIGNKPVDGDEAESSHLKLYSKVAG